MIKQFKTGEALQVFCDNPENYEGGEAYFESRIKKEVENTIEMLYADPSLFDFYNVEIPDVDSISIEFVNHYHAPQDLGNKYLGSIPGIVEELTMQADNGEYAYHYIGTTHFRIFKITD